MNLNLQNTGISVSGFTTIALIFSVAILSFVTCRKKRRLPPGPPGLPVIGSLVSTGLRPLLYLDKLRRQYGEVFTLMFGGKTVIIINGNEAMRELIVKHADAMSDRPSVSQLQLISNGLGKTTYLNKSTVRLSQCYSLYQIGLITRQNILSRPSVCRIFRACIK